MELRRILMGTGRCCGKAVQYYLVENSTDSTVNQYGISLECGKECVTLPGITVSQPRILHLLDVLISGNVTPITLRDVVEDWLLV